MAERIARLQHGIHISYETSGDPAGRPLLLIMGLGGPLSWWSAKFCQQLVDVGFFVIRYDNRDVGRSSRVETGRPVLRRQLLTTYLGDRRSAPYSMSDLAADAVGLLDHLEVDATHLAGVSMGGMVAQTVAIEHTHRVLSLTSIMATTGRRRVGWANPRLLPMLLAPTASSREEYVARAAVSTSLLGSAVYPHDADVLRRTAEETWDRGYSAAGVARQLLAVLTQPDRTRALQRLQLPVCVIHGLADRLVHPSGGRATARAIPGAELVLVPGMAHDLPPQLHGLVSSAIARTADRAETRPAGERNTEQPAARSSRTDGR